MCYRLCHTLVANKKLAQAMMLRSKLCGYIILTVSFLLPPDHTSLGYSGAIEIQVNYLRPSSGEQVRLIGIWSQSESKCLACYITVFCYSVFLTAFLLVVFPIAASLI